MLQPTRWMSLSPSAVTVSNTSSLKSRTPRVASTGLVSVPPNPRRSMANTRRSAGRASMSSCQNRADETLPWMSTTAGPASGSPSRVSTLTASFGVVTVVAEIPSKIGMARSILR